MYFASWHKYALEFTIVCGLTCNIFNITLEFEKEKAAITPKRNAIEKSWKKKSSSSW